MNGVHDVGGMDGFGPIVREKNEPVYHEEWEVRTRAINQLLQNRGLYNLDQSRYPIERINPVYYLASSYYQKWLLRVEALLMEKGVLTESEIQDKMKQISPHESFKPDLEPYREVIPHASSIKRRDVIETSSTKDKDQIKPKFSPGTTVKAKDMSPLGHTRIPRYIRGRYGVIEDIHGIFILPDIKVQEDIDLYQPVYLVRFEAQDLWGEDASPKDKLYIELWEDYLELGGVEND